MRRPAARFRSAPPSFAAQRRRLPGEASEAWALDRAATPGKPAFASFPLFPRIAHPPDRLPRIVGDEKAAVLQHQQPHRPAPDLGRAGAAVPEAGGKILILTGRLPIL